MVLTTAGSNARAWLLNSFYHTQQIRFVSLVVRSACSATTPAARHHRAPNVLSTSATPCRGLLLKPSKTVGAVSRIVRQYSSETTSLSDSVGDAGGVTSTIDPQRLPPSDSYADTFFDLHAYRTTEDDPLKHTAVHLHKFYTATDDACKTLLFNKILRHDFIAQAKAFNELSFMVRAPVLEAKELLFRLAGAESPAPRVLLYGVEGSGKTSAFAQLLHSALASERLIVCPARQYLWNNYYTEVAVSSYKANRIDLPEQGVEFLSNIKLMNRNVLAKYGDSLKTHQRYSWSRREVTEEGSPLEELITFGIDRPKYACDVVGAFLKELRLYSREWPCQTLVAIDGVNSLFGTTKMMKDPVKKERMDIGQFSLVHHLVKLLSAGWYNGSCLLVTDVLSSPCTHRQSPLPRYLLEEKGFDALNPFVPIEVHNYTEQEMAAALDFFVDKQWIQNKKYRNSEAARQELVFLSNKNPHYLDLVLRAA